MTELQIDNEKPLYITNSEIQQFKSCKRQWYLGTYRELTLKVSETKKVGPLALGTKVHLALEEMYTNVGSNPVTVIRELYRDDIEKWPDAREELQKEQDLAVAMLEGYVEWIAETGADEGLELVAAETVVRVPVPDMPNVFLQGKLDQRLNRKIDNARLFLDHKTVQSVSPQLLPLDEQLKFYSLLEFLDAMDKTGGPPAERTVGALYNMLRKVKRTANAKPPFYDRVEVHHNSETMRSMWLRTMRVVQEIMQTRAELDSGGDHRFVAYPRPSRDCSWRCPFLPVCPMMDDGSRWEDMLSEYYERSDPLARYGKDSDGGSTSE